MDFLQTAKSWVTVRRNDFWVYLENELTGERIACGGHKFGGVKDQDWARPPR